MGLINLKTDLKSLRYGKDRIGGGDSGQPYIKTNIPDDISPYIGTQDYINRGGIRVVRDSATDVLRLGKMFIDTKSPNGIFFTTKQELLSRTAARTQTSGVLNEGIYTPLSTLAQAGVVAFGGHLNKQGVNPFEETGAYSQGTYLYFNKVKPNPNDPGASTESNRLVSLYNAVNGNLTVTNFGGITFTGGVGTESKGTTLNIGPNVMQYVGGPGAPLGVGTTSIRYSDQRTGDQNPIKVTNPTYYYGDYPTNITPKQYLTKLNTTGSVTTPLSPENLTIKGKYTQYSGNTYTDQYLDQSETGNQNPLRVTNPSYFYGKNPRIVEPGNYLKNTNVSGSTGKFIRLTGIGIESGYTEDGKLGPGFYFHNVYEPAIEGNTWPKNSPLVYDNNTYTYNQEDLLNTEPTSGKTTGSPRIQDFRKILREKLQGQDREKATQLGATPYSQNYSGENAGNIEKRVNLGDPGQRANKSYANYSQGVIDLATNQSVYSNINVKGIGSTPIGLDKITSLPLYRSENVTNDEIVNDLVKFRIAVIDNDAPNFKTFLHFRAFLDSFSDSYTATWNPIKYLGRGEDFYNYGGFSRQVQLGWTVAAQSKQELIPMYKKLNYLASTLTPDYSSAGYMRGNLVQLTIGGYLYEVPGVMTSLNYEISPENNWEIGIGEEAGQQDGTVKELPHIIKVTSNFTPIHRFLPRTQQLTFPDKVGFPTNYGNERYISIANGSGDKNSNYNYYDTSTGATTQAQ